MSICRRQAAIAAALALWRCGAHAAQSEPRRFVHLIEPIVRALPSAPAGPLAVAEKFRRLSAPERTHILNVLAEALAEKMTVETFRAKPAEQSRWVAETIEAYSRKASEDARRIAFKKDIRDPFEDWAKTQRLLGPEIIFLSDRGLAQALDRAAPALMRQAAAAKAKAKARPDGRSPEEVALQEAQALAGELPPAVEKVYWTLDREGRRLAPETREAPAAMDRGQVVVEVRVRLLREFRLIEKMEVIAGSLSEDAAHKLAALADERNRYWASSHPELMGELLADPLTEKDRLWGRMSAPTTAPDRGDFARLKRNVPESYRFPPDSSFILQLGPPESPAAEIRFSRDKIGGIMAIYPGGNKIVRQGETINIGSFEQKCQILIVAPGVERIHVALRVVGEDIHIVRLSSSEVRIGALKDVKPL